jgi:hypothetical protein
MAISPLATVGVWSAITWKAIWIAAGPTGDKILTVLLSLYALRGQSHWCGFGFQG